MEDCKHEDIIQDVKKAVFGNSHKGLVERVISLQVQMKILLGGVGIVIGLLITLIFNK